jgi:hypothetical protein
MRLEKVEAEVERKLMRKLGAQLQHVQHPHLQHPQHPQPQEKEDMQVYLLVQTYSLTGTKVLALLVQMYKF